MKKHSRKETGKISGRIIAFNVLLKSTLSDEYVSVLLGMELESSRCPPVERALATELVYGSVRMQGTLDWVISKYSQRPVNVIDPLSLVALRLGLYQIMFLTKIPHYASVNESIAILKAREKTGSASFVNAILRRYLREKDSLIYPNRENNPVDYISVVYSHPAFLVERWINKFGFGTAETLCRINNIPAPTYIRTNTLKISRTELMTRLKNEGVSCTIVETNPFALSISNYQTLHSLKTFKEGLYYIQDINSMRAVIRMQPQQGENILDMCSAPGGKTTFIAQQMQKRGRIIACEKDSSKIPLIEENIKRLGVENVEIINDDAVKLPGRFPEWVNFFDRILIDAPCTNTGVLRRRVEARWRLGPADFQKMSALEGSLLDSACQLVKPGGVLVYSTCSIDPSENTETTHSFLSRNPEMKLNLEEEFMPEEQGGDGGYVARFIKTAT